MDFELRIADIVFQTHAEGEGERTALWLQGCSIGCKGCCNPELLNPEGGESIQVAQLLENIRRKGCPKLTIVGGEPLDQPKPLRIFLEGYRRIFGQNSDVWLFSGYDYTSIVKDKNKAACLSLCDIVISGPFIADLCPDRRKWIGSRNQQIHANSTKGEAMLSRWPENEFDIEIELSEDSIRINGWPMDN